MTQFWLGDHASQAEFLKRQDQLEAAVAANLHADEAKLYSDYDEDEDVREFGQYTYMLDDYDGVAVMNINGVLTNSNHWANQYYGLVSYEEIGNAAITAVEAGAKALILYVSSPGGTASGINSASKILSDVAKIIPVETFTDSIMASGGYWLGSVGKKIWADEMATVGSIGVITTLVSYKKMYDEIGIDTKVVRAGKFKALGQPTEAISDAVVKETEDRLAEIYDVFLEHVGVQRNMTRDTLIEQAAEGRTFLGRKATEVGLVDKVSSLSDMIGMHQKRISKSESNTYLSTNQPEGEEPMAKKKLLTEESIAALASGATQEEVNASGGPDADVNETDVTDVVEETNTDADVKDEVVADVVEEPTEVAAESATAPLLSQIADLNKQILGLSVAAATHEAKLEEVRNELASAMVCVKEATTRLMIPLGASLNIEGFSNPVVLETYASMKVQFDKTFKIGASASTVVDKDQSQSDGETDSSVSGAVTQSLTKIGQR